MDHHSIFRSKDQEEWKDMGGFGLHSMIWIVIFCLLYNAVISQFHPVLLFVDQHVLQ